MCGLGHFSIHKLFSPNIIPILPPTTELLDQGGKREWKLDWEERQIMGNMIKSLRSRREKSVLSPENIGIFISVGVDDSSKVNYQEIWGKVYMFICSRIK